MIKTLPCYFKHQKNYILFLMIVFVLPLALFWQYSTYKLPKVQYVFLGALFVSQYILFREKEYRRKWEGRIKKILNKEIGRVPSRKEIYARLDQVIYFRGISIVITGVCIVVLMISYKEY